MQSRCITLTLHLLLTPFLFLLYKKETCPQKWLLVPYGLQCLSFSSDTGEVWRQWGSLLTLALCLSTPGPWWHPVLQGLLVALWCPMLALPGSGKQTSREVLIRAMLHIKVQRELGRSDPMSLKLAVRSVSSALVRTLVNFCHADWHVLEAASLVIGDSCPEQNWKANTSLAR